MWVTVLGAGVLLVSQHLPTSHFLQALLICLSRCAHDHRSAAMGNECTKANTFPACMQRARYVQSSCSAKWTSSVKRTVPHAPTSASKEKNKHVPLFMYTHQQIETESSNLMRISETYTKHVTSQGCPVCACHVGPPKIPLHKLEKKMS